MGQRVFRNNTHYFYEKDFWLKIFKDYTLLSIGCRVLVDSRCCSFCCYYCRFIVLSICRESPERSTFIPVFDLSQVLCSRTLETNLRSNVTGKFIGPKSEIIQNFS